APATLGQLLESGYRARTTKEEIRSNLIDRLRSGETAFPGIVGFDDSVLPELETALLAGHDLMLLGERGQGKTRLMRTLVRPLDVVLVATANPEDYTNRGRIITPLKDRFGAELRTHYLTELADEVALLRQEARLVAEVGDHLLDVVATLTGNLRESSSVDQRS